MLVYGKQTVYHLIERSPGKIKQLYLAKNLEPKAYHRLMQMGIDIKRIPAEAAQSMSKSGNHQGFLAEVSDLEPHALRDLIQYEYLLVLNGLTDVGNIGAIIRSAYALGVDAVILSGVKSVAFEQVARSSSGALFEMPIALIFNIHDLLNELKMAGFTLYGADMEGEDIRHVHLDAKRVLILGSEGEGMGARVLKKVDQKIKIVMKHGFDSLNVSAAGAILIDRMRHA